MQVFMLRPKWLSGRDDHPEVPTAVEHVTRSPGPPKTLIAILFGVILFGLCDTGTGGPIDSCGRAYERLREFYPDLTWQPLNAGVSLQRFDAVHVCDTSEV